ncbi:3-oxoacyl-[acyl-carrier protein] reductase [Duganella sp. CF458]|uniref:3-oxoacyl-ACP reductase n=1 Tax=Duganella sp. CF458 TaxID=1884368 RepID=UPI0008E705B4|nr:3-oxoacyl-ACP reductase [Duganella sp. CF458]SFG82698.1 3-oxoacyl-[acyl-carrier protein] reductase [Duganella sp. CF458]
MPDTLIRINRWPVIGPIVRAIGLPNPTELLRSSGPYAALPFEGKSYRLASVEGGYASAALAAALRGAGATEAADAIDIFVMDASGCRTVADLSAMYAACQPELKRIGRNGRVLLIAPLLSEAGDPMAAAVARGLEGFVRSLAKELGRRGATANLASVSRQAMARLDGVVRFFCGPQCAYVSGQAIQVSAETAGPDSPPRTNVLAGKVALVTGAARGIGLATAERLAQEGAKVVLLDIPPSSEELTKIANRIGAAALALDIAHAASPAVVASYLRENFGGVDIVVHNAGITRDRTLAKMEPQQWDQVLQINLSAIAAIDKQLHEDALLRDHGRVVCLSSISGIAGNFGQTNYATSKAALIGYVAAQAPLHAARGITFNAVAPGFIETPMTGKVPFLTREIGRRLNSLSQGGQPRDVAELVAFLCTPGACGISGQTIRVCGQGLMGA